MYYLKYILKSDDNLAIQNLKKVIDHSNEYLKTNNKIDIHFVNNIHKILLDIVRGDEKEQRLTGFFILLLTK